MKKMEEQKGALSPCFVVREFASPFKASDSEATRQYYEPMHLQVCNNRTCK